MNFFLNLPSATRLRVSATSTAPGAKWPSYGRCFLGEQWPRVPAPSGEVGVDPLSAVAAEAARRLERAWPEAGVVSSIMSDCCIAPELSLS